MMLRRLFHASRTFARRVRTFLYGVLLLDRTLAVDALAWRLHVLGVAACLVIGWTGFLVGRFPWEGEFAEIYRRSGVLLLSAALAIHLLLRLLPLLYAWPLRRTALSRSLLAKYPFLAFALAVALHLGTALSPYAFWVIRGGASPGWGRILALVLLVVCAFPFWLLVLHPLRVWREARELGSRPRHLIRDAVLRFVRSLGAIGRACGEIVSGVRSRRAEHSEVRHG